MRRFLLPVTMALLTAGVLLWAWSLVEQQRPPAPVQPAPVVREAFDGTQPLALHLAPAPDAAREDLRAWLKDELDYLLPRAHAIRYETSRGRAASTFVLDIAIAATPAPALELRLIAPDDFIERRTTLAINELPRFEILTQLLTRIPQFLGLSADWRELLGTSDRAAYEAVMQAREAQRMETRSSSQRVRSIERLERITRQHPKYARAWSTLSLAYLRLESEDARSLRSLALKAAERALALDEDEADAHAVRGFVQYHAGQWLTAYEDVTHALSLQPDSLSALETLACLLTDAGHSRRAKEVAARALKVNEESAPAQECAAFASAARGADIQAGEQPPFAVARLLATTHFLSGDVATGKRLYRQAARRENRRTPWLDATAKAVQNPSHTVDALRALTFAESEQQIDATTEMLAGLTLQRPDFVINRVRRLQRDREVVPFRVLWLPHAREVRQHSAFDDVIRISDLPAFWQTHGLPDVCEQEPKLTICR